MGVYVSYASWSSRNSINISIRLNPDLRRYFIQEGGGVTNPTTVVTTTGTTTVGERLRYESEIHYTSTRFWMTVKVTYVGPNALVEQIFDLPLVLPASLFSCSFLQRGEGLGGGSGEEDEEGMMNNNEGGIISDGGSIPLRVLLISAPELPRGITETMDVTLGVTVGTVVVPSGLVRAGMMSSLIGMLRCVVFVPDDELEFINNPFNLAIGERQDMQFQRGSAVTALSGLFVYQMIIFLVLGIVRCVVGGWSRALSNLRLPSSQLPVMILLSEICVSPAVSLILYEHSDGGDVTLGVVVVIPILIYVCLYVVRAVTSGAHTKVVPVLAPTPPPPNAATGEQQENGVGGNAIQRVAKFVLEPTHEVTLGTSGLIDSNVPGNVAQNRETMAGREKWLRRNYFFVAERRWAMFGAVEVLGGTLTNILDGIPLTSSNRYLCIARPVCVMLITTSLLFLLVWRTPNAVRLQQWIALVITAGTMLTAVLVVSNVLAPSEDLELSAGYMGTIVMGVSLYLTLVEIVGMCIMSVPWIRSALTLVSHTLQSAVDRSNTNQAQQQPQPAAANPNINPPPAAAAQLLAVPLLPQLDSDDSDNDVHLLGPTPDTVGSKDNSELGSEEMIEFNRIMGLVDAEDERLRIKAEEEEKEKRKKIPTWKKGGVRWEDDDEVDDYCVKEEDITPYKQPRHRIDAPWSRGGGWGGVGSSAAAASSSPSPLPHGTNTSRTTTATTSKRPPYRGIAATRQANDLHRHRLRRQEEEEEDIL